MASTQRRMLATGLYRRFLKRRLFTPFNADAPKASILSISRRAFFRSEKVVSRSQACCVGVPFRRRQDRPRAMRARRRLLARWPGREVRRRTRSAGRSRGAAACERRADFSRSCSAWSRTWRRNGNEALRDGEAALTSAAKPADAIECRAQRLLKIQAIETCGFERVENQVPTMSRNRARNRHEAMATKKIVAKGLLARARNPRSQPIGVWHVVAFDDVNLGNIRESSTP